MRSLKCDGPVFMNVCEPSGDLYASHLIRAIKVKDPNLKIFAIGSQNMAHSGADILMDYSKMMTLGFTSGIFSSLHNYSIYRKIGRMMYKIRPKTFIGVAYPGMNLLLSKYAKNLGCKVYYFLPPQIWAWGTFRKYFIKQWVDTVISVFPFEFEFYRKIGINTVLMENPLFRALDKYKRKNFNKKVGFMPGSRTSEIKRNLPVIIELAKRISQTTNDVECSLILHPDSMPPGREAIAGRILKSVPGLMITTKNRYQIMKDCDLLIICSGTASLEAAAMKKPQVFFNRPAFIDYYLMRRFLKISEYNLTNLYFKNNIVPSFVSADAAYLIEKIHDFLYKTFFD